MTRSPFDAKNLRRILDLAESPTVRLAREMENNPATRLMRDMEKTSASIAVTRLIEESDLAGLSASVSATQNAFDMMTKSEQWAGMSTAIERANHVLHQPETAAVIQQITNSLKDMAIYADHAVIPLAEQIQRFSVVSAQAVQPLQNYHEHMENWQTSLAARMATMAKPWAIEGHLGVSMVGFARIARLHDISTGPTPFDAEAAEIFEDELGKPLPFDQEDEPDDREAARIDSGLTPEVIAFPPSSYPSILFSAGFELRVKPSPQLKTDKGDDSGSFDPQHAGLFGQVENHLRNLVETELKKLDGARWYRRANA